MTELQNLEKASGLGTRSEIIESLLNRMSSVSDRNKRLQEYYEGDFNPPGIGIDTIPDTAKVEMGCDWPRKAVTSVSERTRFDGFVFNGDYRDSGLENIVLENALVSNFNLNIPNELTVGCMFGTVGKWRDKCQVRFHTAETAVAEWDSGSGQLAYGMVVADWKTTSWSPQKKVPVQVNLHLPGEIVILTRTAPSSWQASVNSTPLNRPMMESFAFRPTGVKPFGVSRITKTVQTISDEVIRTLQNMAVCGALYAAPQKYLLGLSDEQYDAVQKDKFSYYIGSIFLATRDENGDTPTYGQLSAASPQPYIDALRTQAMLFSGATGVPLNSLGIIQDNPSSAEAISASREDICIAAEDLISSNSVGLRNIALMAMAVDNNTSIDGLTDDQKSVTAHFKDPSMPSIVSQADAMVKIAAAAPWIAESEVFLERLGFDDATRKRLIADKKKFKASQMLMAEIQNIKQLDKPEILKVEDNK